MNEEDKAKTAIPESPAQHKLEKLDHRDKIVRGIELFVLALVVSFNIYLGVSIRQIITSNQAATEQARQANIARQDSLKAYVKCLTLLKFEPHPEILQTKDGVSKALDKCAADTSSPQ